MTPYRIAPSPPTSTKSTPSGGSASARLPKTRAGMFTSRSALNTISAPMPAGSPSVMARGFTDAIVVGRAFREALECGGVEPPLWEGGGRESSRRLSKHHTLRVMTIPPPSQSGGSTPPHSKVLRTKSGVGLLPSQLFLFEQVLDPVFLDQQVGGAVAVH